MRIYSATLLALAVMPLGAATLEDTLSELKESLAYGKASVFARARSESVDSDFFKEKAHANTLRLSLGYETKPFHGFALGCLPPSCATPSAYPIASFTVSGNAR